MVSVSEARYDYNQDRVLRHDFIQYIHFGHHNFQLHTKRAARTAESHRLASVFSQKTYLWQSFKTPEDHLALFCRYFLKFEGLFCTVH